jgi:ATP-dependent Clp protease ATP-binding subunit ClpA
LVQVTEAMRMAFRPEFLNRIDEFIIFNSLRKDQLRDIVKLELRKMEKRLAERQITLEVRTTSTGSVLYDGTLSSELFQWIL